MQTWYNIYQLVCYEYKVTVEMLQERMEQRRIQRQTKEMDNKSVTDMKLALAKCSIRENVDSGRGKHDSAPKC